MSAEPALVPVLQVVRTRQPESIVSKPGDGEVAHQSTGRAQHRREADLSDVRDARGDEVIEPRFCARSGHLVARVLGDLIGTCGSTHGPDLVGDDRLRVGSSQRVGFVEVGRRREVQRHLQAPVHGELRAFRTEDVVARRGLERPPGWELFVRVGHHEAACVELRGRGTQVAVVGGVGAEACDVHAEDVVAGIAVHDPIGQRESDARALREPGHAAARGPVAGDALDRSDQRIAIRSEGERPIHPFLDADILQHREALERHPEFGRDAIHVFGEQRHAEIPGRALDRPVDGVLLIDTEEHAIALALQVGEALEVCDCGHQAADRGDLGDRSGDQVVVRHRHEGMVNTHHAPDATRP